MNGPLSDERLAEIRAWARTWSPLNFTIAEDLIGEVERLKAELRIAKAIEVEALEDIARLKVRIEADKRGAESMGLALGESIESEERLTAECAAMERAIQILEKRSDA